MLYPSFEQTGRADILDEHIGSQANRSEHLYSSLNVLPLATLSRLSLVGIFALFSTLWLEQNRVFSSKIVDFGRASAEEGFCANPRRVHRNYQTYDPNNYADHRCTPSTIDRRANSNLFHPPTSNRRRNVLARAPVELPTYDRPTAQDQLVVFMFTSLVIPSRETVAKARSLSIILK